MLFRSGQSTPSNEPSFIPGEQYKYDLFVDLIKVGPDLVKLGSATLSTKKIEIINGQKAYHLNFSVKTSKIGDMLFKIRDTIDVWVNTESLELIQQTKKLREGSRKSKSFTTISERSSSACTRSSSARAPYGCAAGCAAGCDRYVASAEALFAAGPITIAGAEVRHAGCAASSPEGVIVRYHTFGENQTSDRHKNDDHTFNFFFFFLFHHLVLPRVVQPRSMPRGSQLCKL